MLIDLILDRKDDLSENKHNYSAYGFYRDLCEYGHNEIAYIMDCSSENSLKAALCKYVLDSNYNPAICGFICSVNWLADDNETRLKDLAVYDSALNDYGKVFTEIEKSHLSRFRFAAAYDDCDFSSYANFLNQLLAKYYPA